ncbi:prolyl 4-hydroxylase [Luteibacter rhizovicinus]|uniref:Prolyl 4-hydroxylase n=2 Tax=Luteibacter rhizovicinus TaxID=242606 RepID=A0A4R3YPN0_9GAMM|nr:prolyl 4-hydroxylase [Luteibacter rhizovicinus]
MRFAREWAPWLAEAGKAGRSARDLLAEMARERLDETAAREVIEEFFARLTGAPAPWQRAPLRSLGKGPADEAGAFDTDSRMPSGHVIHAVDRDVRVLTRVKRPIIAVLDNVLSAQECDRMRSMGRPKLSRSKVMNTQTGDEMVMDIRTSEGCYFERGGNELIRRIEARASAIMGMAPEHGEPLQLVRYRAGGEYVPHCDFFPLDSPGSDAHLAIGGQRVSTLIMYLCDVQSGGETVFPEIGFSYVPRKGQALYFEYTDATGASDPLSLHAGAPLGSGEKWILTKWMRERACVY